MGDDVWMIETYRVDHPWGAVPRRGVHGCPDIEEDNRCYAAARQMVLRILGRLDNTDVRADRPHAKRANDGTQEQELPSSKLIYQEK